MLQYLHKIKTFLGDMWTTSTNAEDQTRENSLNEKSQIIEREQLKGTPFWIIKTEQGWFLVMGENRLSEVMPTKERVKGWLLNNQWQVIMQIIVIVTNKIKQEEVNNHIKKTHRNAEQFIKQ